MNKLRFILISAALVLVHLLGHEAMAQNIKVSGYVRDAAGEPVIGATVVVEGTGTGTSTGIDGEY